MISRHIRSKAMLLGLGMVLAVGATAYFINERIQHNRFQESLVQMQDHLSHRPALKKRRILADLGDRPACYLDRFRGNFLVRELRSLESSFENNEFLDVQKIGSDEGLQNKLSEALRELKKRVNTAQGSFLTGFIRGLPKELVKDLEFNCNYLENPECVVESARLQAGIQESNDERSEAAMLTYYWYLKTKTFLGGSMDPEKPYAFSPATVFFTKTELSELIRSLSLLPEAYFRVPVFGRIFRVPMDSDYESKHPSEKNLLGLAGNEPWYAAAGRVGRDGIKLSYYPSSEAGYIKLYERTLLDIRKKNQKNKTGNFLDTTFIHELSHQVDMTDGAKQIPQMVRFSLTPRWLKESGWKLTVYHDEPNHAELLWENDEKLEAKAKNKFQKMFASSYSRTSPVEDFAESLSYYVTGPDWFMKQLESKAFVLQDEFFRGRRYDDDGLRRKYVAQALLSATSQVKSLAQAECPQTIDAHECLKTLTKKLSLLAEAEIKSLDPQGCDFFSEVSNVTSFRDEFVKYFGDWEPAMFEGDIEKTIHTVSTQFDVRSMYFECVKAESSYPDDLEKSAKVKACFDKRFKRDLETTVSRINPNHIRLMKSLSPFLEETQGYVSARALSLKWFDEFLKPALFSSSQVAEKVYTKCSNQPLKKMRSGEVRFEPYSGGDEYVEGRFLTCLNEGLATEVTKLMERLALSASISSKSLMDWGVSRLLRYATGAIDFRVSYQRTADAEKLDDWFRKRARKVNFETASFDKCLKETHRVLTTKLEENLDDIDLRFIEPKSAVYQFAYDFCVEETAPKH